MVIEIVGLSPALKMGFELLRPWGIISSVGVHNGEVSVFLLDDRKWKILISLKPQENGK